MDVGDRFREREVKSWRGKKEGQKEVGLVETDVEAGGDVKVEDPKREAVHA